jgi:hypothetical protein
VTTHDCSVFRILVYAMLLLLALLLSRQTNGCCLEAENGCMCGKEKGKRVAWTDVSAFLVRIQNSSRLLVTPTPTVQYF